jgi:transposase
MTTPKPTIVELSMNEWEDILQRAKAVLNEKDYQIVKAVVQSYAYVTDLLEDKRTTIDRLRKLLFGSPTEKTRDVVPPTQAAPPSTVPPGVEPLEQAEPLQEEATPPPGHGRNGADDYSGAERIAVPHGLLSSGDICPDCEKGKVYQLASPGVLVRIVGQAPVQAKVYELEKFRCNLCGKVFTAEVPEGVGPEKYDATAGSMIALLKYGSGLPFHRLEGLQGALGIPLPASTQWDIVNAVAGTVEPVYEELIRQAAQGQVLHNDDTTVKILEFMSKTRLGEGKRAKKEVLADFGESPDTVGGHAVADSRTEDTPDDAPPARPQPSAAMRSSAQRRGEGKAERRGLFTSGIVSTSEGRRIALFFSSRKHAGENLTDVLAHRAADLAPPIQMCDALSRNVPAAFKTLLGNCLAHGRRQFVDVAERFPEECRYVLESLADVYKNDAIARERNLSPEARLAFHQAESGPIMKKLQAWCIRQFAERLVEPNSGLGAAISYLLRHWEKLTLFLRQPGAPLDNNIVERALKKSILHRKNSLFYKTLNGAHVGDIFMSLIYTCQLCGADPFDYLTQLQRHAEDLAARPEDWMPWNYRNELRA